MARRKGTRRSRGYGRRIAKGARRGGSKMLRMFGVGKGGVHAGRMLATMSAIATPFVPIQTAATGGTACAADAIFNPSKIWTATPSMTTRIYHLGMGSLYAGLGVGPFKEQSSKISTAAGITGMGVLAGVGLSVAGKFVNPMLSGSAVKL